MAVVPLAGKMLKFLELSFLCQLNKLAKLTEFPYNKLTKLAPIKPSVYYKKMHHNTDGLV